MRRPPRSLGLLVVTPPLFSRASDFSDWFVMTPELFQLDSNLNLQSRKCTLKWDLFIVVLGVYFAEINCPLKKINTCIYRYFLISVAMQTFSPATLQMLICLNYYIWKTLIISICSSKKRSFVGRHWRLFAMYSGPVRAILVLVLTVGSGWSGRCTS